MARGTPSGVAVFLGHPPQIYWFYAVGVVGPVIGLLTWMVFHLPEGRTHRSAGFACASGLKQEPGASLGLVDPVFQQACSGHVAVLAA